MSTPLYDDITEPRREFLFACFRMFVDPFLALPVYRVPPPKMPLRIKSIFSKRRVWKKEKRTGVPTVFHFPQK